MHVYIVYLDFYFDGICAGSLGGSDDCHKARALFDTVETKESEAEEILGNVRQAFMGIQESTDSIHSSLSGLGKARRRLQILRKRFLPARKDRLKKWAGALRFSTR